MRWRGTLFAKEIRQNTGTLAALCGLFAVFLAILGLRANQTKSGLLVAFAPTLYWATVGVTAVMGSAFLAEENGARSANFLLRLPVARRRIFLAKLSCHVSGVIVFCAVALLLMKTFAHFTRIIWLWPAARRAPDLYVAAVGIPLAYFLTVCFSVVLDRALTAFLAAAASAALLYAVGQYVSSVVAGGFSGTPLFDTYLVHLVNGIWLTLALAGAVAVSWLLFLRKEGQ